MSRTEPISVLLVEDNEDHAELVKRTLSDLRVIDNLLHLSDGEAALDYLFRRGAYSDPATSPRPHVVLLDLRLPRVDGLEVLKIIKGVEELRHIPVIVLTSSDAESDVTRAYNNHANSYVVKPVGFEAFVELMEDFGQYWLNWNIYT